MDPYVMVCADRLIENVLRSSKEPRPDALADITACPNRFITAAALLRLATDETLPQPLRESDTAKPFESELTAALCAAAYRLLWKCREAME